MNTLINIYELLLSFNIDLLIVLLVIASGYFQYRYMSAIMIKAVYKTLIVATALTALYILLTCDFKSWVCVKPCLLTALISYTVATSFYETIVKYTMETLQSKFGKTKQNESSNT